MIFALYNRVLETKNSYLIEKVIEHLEANNIQIAIYKDLYKVIRERVTFKFKPIIFSSHLDLPNNTDFFISMGGDGTILDSLIFIGNKEIPVIGINLGRLGFLASISPADVIFALDALITGNYSIDERSLIHLDSNLPLFDEAPFALNEFTIHRKDTSSMIKIHTYLNGEFLNTYWSDGLIISTPTGSTGYSLSCNGPLVLPGTSNFIITPVAPHNLNIRPMIVPDNTILSFEVEGRTDQFLCTLDSRSATITKSYQLAVRKESFKFKLIRLNDQNFFDALREKLYWGVDSRN